MIQLMERRSTWKQQWTFLVGGTNFNKSPSHLIYAFRTETIISCSDKTYGNSINVYKYRALRRETKAQVNKNVAVCKKCCKTCTLLFKSNAQITTKNIIYFFHAAAKKKTQRENYVVNENYMQKKSARTQTLFTRSIKMYS